MVSLENRFVKNNDIAWRIIDGEALVVNPKDSLIYPLNGIGTRIWESLDGKKNIGEIVSIICEEFEVDKKIARDDVTDFVEGLLKAGLIDGM